ncbi:Sds3-like-domain-containing protein [Fennellomyces sp. T-0311]|nr:Sds3-like-domain-containing protein [Fennellomyces sp. T-0311]
MEGNCSVNSSDGIEDDASTRPDSSRLSLGSSPSELTDEDDANPSLPNPDDDFPLDDGDGSLTPTDKIIMDDEDAPQEFDDDGLFEDSSDTLSNAPMDIDEREDEEEPFSSLSSVQAPLSPEPQQEDPPEEEDDEEQENNGVDQHVESSTQNAKENEKPVHKKRRGSMALVQEEWQQRRTSKLLENKETMAGLANAVENTEETGQSSESPPLKSETVKDEKEKDPVAEENDAAAQDSEAIKEEEKGEHDDEEDHQQQHQDHQEEERVLARNEEYQRWHKEALDALTKIEVEFARLRDKMYQEKMSELNEEALMIARGTHPELVTMMETIEKKKNKRIQTAEAWRKYKRISYQQQFQGLEYQANIDFVSGKNALRRDLLGSLNRKRWDLDNERDKLNEPLSDADRVPDPSMLLQRKRTQADESRDLHRVTQSIGFPIAPRTTGISSKSIEEDLIALGIIEARK